MAVFGVRDLSFVFGFEVLGSYFRFLGFVLGVWGFGGSGFSRFGVSVSGLRFFGVRGFAFRV